MADRKTKYVLTAEDRTKGAFDSLRGNLKSVEDQASRIPQAFAAIGAVVAALGLSQVFGQSIDAMVALEKSTLRLDAVLRATGDTIGFTRAELNKFIQTSSSQSVFSENEFRDAISILATFKSVQGEAFKEGIRLASDLSAVMDQSLKSSVVQLGKALEDPVIGLSALREVGISFTQNQQDLIKTLAESGQKMEAQVIILEALEGQFGGTGATLKQGVHGAIIATDNAWTNLLATMGETGPTKLVVENSLLGIADLFDVIREAIEKSNRELDKSVLFDGTLRQRLDPISGAPQSAGAEFGSNQLTLDEVNAIGRAERAALDAKAAADAQRRKEDAEKLAKATAIADKERLQEATFQSKQFADEQIKAVRELAEAERERFQEAGILSKQFAEDQERALDAERDRVEENNRLAESFKSSTDSANAFLATLRLETDLITANSRTRQHLIDMRILESTGVEDNTVLWNKYVEVITRVRNVQEELNKSWEFGATSALQRYTEDAIFAAETTERLFTNAFNGLEDALVDLAITGEDTFRELANNIIRELLRIQIQQSITAPFASLLQGSIAAFAGRSTATAQPVPGFATGGSFTVGGSGGTDSKFVGFMATPGERVTVQTPGQQRGGGGPTIYIDARGADAAGLARLERLVANMNGTIEHRAVAAVANAKGRGGSFAGLVRS